MTNDEIGNLTVKIAMDNSGFQAGVSALNRQLKVVQSDFKAATSKLGEFGTSTDQLKLKADSLTKQMDLQRQKVETLQIAYNKSAESKGTDAKATQDLQIKLNKAVTELANTESELKKTTQELDKQSSMWTKLSKVAEDAGSKLKSAGEKISNVGKSLSTTITAPLLAGAAASVKLASDMSESLNKVEVAFGNNSKQIETWSNTTLRQFGIAKGSALDMAALFGDMGTAMGQTTDTAAEMSTNLVGLAGDLASFKNISLDQASNALKGIYTGEGESLKSLGVIMQDSTLEAYALATGQQKAYKEMEQAEKVALRYAFVMDATKNSQGDFARTSDGTANQMRIFTESIKELGASFGQYLLPVITPILTKLNNAIQTFGGLDEKTKKLILVIGGVAAAIGPIILISGKLITAVGAISSTVSAASAGIAGAGGLTAALSAVAVPIAAVVAAVIGLSAIFVSLYRNNEDFRNNINQIWGDIQNSISSAIDSIISIIALFVEVVNQIWNAHGQEISRILNGFLNIALTLINTALGVIKNIITAFSALISGDWETFFKSLENITSLVLNAISTIIDLQLSIIKNLFNILKNTVISIFSSLFNGVRLKMIDVVSTIQDNLTAALDWISNLPDQMYEYGVNMIQGLIDGVKEKIKELKRAIKDVADTVKDGVKSALNINSPSRVMMEMGGFITEGLAVGIEDEKAKVLNAMNSVSSLISSIKMGASANSSTYNTYNNTSPSNSIHIDSLITIEGNVDSSTMPKVQQAVDNGIKKLENMLKINNTRVRTGVI